MLGPRKQPEGTGKIRLPKMQANPDMAQLQIMFNQADENKLREVEQTWVQPATMKTYSLSCKYERGGLRPMWTLWEESEGQAQMLWQQESSDMELIGDMVTMSAPAGAPSIASGSMTGLPAGGSAGLARQSMANAPAFSSRDAFQSAAPANPFESASSSRPFDSAAQPTFEGAHTPAAQSTFQGAQARSAPSGFGETTGHAPRFSEQGLAPKRDMGFDGTIEKVPISSLLDSISSDGLTGRLELLGDESVGEIYFLNGIPMYAHVAGILGDNAVRELVTWRTGTFAFFPEQQTEIRNVHRKLMETVMEGIALLDKKKHLERMGLTPDAYLAKKHRNLGDTEVRLLLSKGEPIDMNLQMEVYNLIGHRYSLNDLLRDKPMESADWTPIIFNFLTCDLIEVRPPDAVKVGALDFLGENKAELDSLLEALIRPETGVLSYSAFLLYLQHEFFRFEAYGWPMSIILFEMHQKKESDDTRKQGALETRVDLLPPQAVMVAAQRINMVKRPLDILGHYETLEYALLLPNTRTASAAYVANRIMQTLTISPLGAKIDKKNLKLAFGIANLPSDGDTLYDLLHAVRRAKDKAVSGNFPIVIAKSMK